MFQRKIEEHSRTLPRQLNETREILRSPTITIIGPDVILTGNLSSTGTIQLHGKINGNVRCAALEIGAAASIQGDIIAESVSVRGSSMGEVRAQKVLLASTANIKADVLYDTLAVEPGARFDGYCRHSDDPLSDDTAGPKSTFVTDLCSDATRSSFNPADTLVVEPTTEPAEAVSWIEA